MKVAFLKAPIGGIIGLEMITFVEPLGLECVAGGLGLEGHQCRIVDLRIDGLERGLTKTRSFAPDIVGLQCNFTTERFRLLQLARRVRRELPDALVVVGGHDASRDPNWFLHPAIDVVVVGDGEEVMPALVRAHERGEDPARVPGLVLNRPGGPVATGHAPARADLDELPLPARHLISEYADEYVHQLSPAARPAGNRSRLPLQVQLLLGVEVPREHLPREVPGAGRPGARPDPGAQRLHHRRHLLDERPARRRARRGAQGLRHPQALHPDTRSDIVTRFPELIESWKECGRMTVFLGLEKIDDSALSSVNKKNSVANNNRAIEILQDLGIGYTPNFIIDPGWEREDFDKLKRWIDRTGAYNSGFSVSTPLPGTELWDEVEDDLTTRDWELFDITHAVLPTRLPLAEFYRELGGLWKHTMDVRYAAHGRLQVHLGLLAALASRRVTFQALRKGMRMGAVLGRPENSPSRPPGQRKEAGGDRPGSSPRCAPGRPHRRPDGGAGETGAVEVAGRDRSARSRRAGRSLSPRTAKERVPIRGSLRTPISGGSRPRP